MYITMLIEDQGRFAPRKTERPPGDVDMQSGDIDELRLKRAGTVREIRDILGRTQQELARALGVSVKAVQSYEQGWRDVPVRVLIQLVVLLALYRKHSMDDMPCWKIRKCDDLYRKKCSSFLIGGGQFCWFVGSNECLPPGGKDDKDILPCMSCPVVQRLLKGPDKGNTGGL